MSEVNFEVEFGNCVWNLNRRLNDICALLCCKCCSKLRKKKQIEEKKDLSNQTSLVTLAIVICILLCLNKKNSQSLEDGQIGSKKFGPNLPTHVFQLSHKIGFPCRCRCGYHVPLHVGLTYGLTGVGARDACTSKNDNI